MSYMSTMIIFNMSPSYMIFTLCSEYNKLFALSNWKQNQSFESQSFKGFISISKVITEHCSKCYVKDLCKCTDLDSLV